MKILDIAKTIGTIALNVAAPGIAPVVIGAINEFLPDDEKLKENATGTQIQQTISSLPPDIKAKIIEKEFDVEITQIKESYETVRMMLESDAKNPHTTRPYVAKNSFKVVAFTIITTVSAWSFAVLSENETMVDAVMDGWPFILAVIGPLVTLLYAYFGVLKKEQKNRLDAANGSTSPGGLTEIISTILRR